MSKKITTIRAEESLFEDLKAEAKRQGRSFNNLITLVLSDYAKDRNKQLAVK